MEIRSSTYRTGRINRLAFTPETRQYERETDEHEETVYYGVEIVDGEEVIATAAYPTPEDVPSDPEPGMLPPDLSGFYAEAAATVGAAKADEWMIASPSTIRALDAGNYALARAGIASARQRSILTNDERDQLLSLMDKYRLKG